MGVFGRDEAFDLMIFDELKDSENEAEANAARDILGLPRVEEEKPAKPKSNFGGADGSMPRAAPRRRF